MLKQCLQKKSIYNKIWGNNLKANPSAKCSGNIVDIKTTAKHLLENSITWRAKVAVTLVY